MVQCVHTFFDTWIGYAVETHPGGTVVTGASSGFGLSMTRLVLKNGDIAVAASRKPESLAPLAAEYNAADRLLALKIDLTSRQSIADAFAEVKRAFGRLDVVAARIVSCA